MALTFLRDKFDPNSKRIITIGVDVLIMLFAFAIMFIGGTKLSFAASMEYSALLGVPRSLVYSMAPISGLFIVVIQIINIYEDFTGVNLSDQNNDSI